MRQALPLVDSTRVEFGFERTVCACDQCTGYCRHVQGYLVPAIWSACVITVAVPTLSTSGPLTIFSPRRAP